MCVSLHARRRHLHLSRVYASGSVPAHEPEQCGSSRASFSPTEPASIHSVPTLALMRRRRLTHIHHLNCCENPRKAPDKYKTRLPALPPSEPDEAKRTRTLVGKFSAAVQRSETAGGRDGRIVSEAQKRVCVREVTISTQGLSAQPGESLAAGQPPSAVQKWGVEAAADANECTCKRVPLVASGVRNDSFPRQMRHI